MYEPSDDDIAAAEAVLSADEELTEARKGGGLANVVKWLSKAGGAHPHSTCTAKFEGKVSNVDAFCAAAVDQLKGTTKWRGKAKEGAMDKITESIEIRREVEGTAGREWDILVIKPGVSKNGVWYEPSVLRQAAQLYEGAVSYDRHGTGEARSFKERIGRLHTVTYDTREGEEGIWARLRVIDPSVREKLLEAAEAGELHTVGFSHDVMAENEQAQYQGRKVRKARRIESVNSVDMVERPSAGGRMSRLVAGEVDGMERDEIQTLVSESVKEAMAAANADLVKAFREAQIGGRTQEQPTEITATTIQTGGESFSLLEEVRKANEEASTALREAKKERQRNLLTSLLDATKITEVSKTFLRARFEEAIARRDLEDAEIKTMVDQTVEHEAVIIQGRSDPNVPGSGRFSVTGAERDTIIKRLDAMFLSPQEKPEGGVRPFSSFKEAYIKFTGKWNADVYEMMEDYLPSKGYISSRDHERVQESVATSSWGQIFADSMYRNMIKAYQAAPWYDAWRLIVSTIENVPDFRTRHWMRIGGYGDLPIVAEGATYTQATSPTDEEETYTIAKRGYIDDITMEAIINDDVGVVSRILREMGRAAARTLYRFVMDLATTSNPTLGDGIALYDSGTHGNTSTNALSVSGVDITSQAMAAQTGYGQSQEILGDRNLLRYLILPPELGALGERILNPSDQYLATVSNAGTDTTLDPAMFKGQGKRALTYHNLTDATDWYAVADPTQVETIVMGFLNGRQEPEFFTQDQPEVGSVFTADKISYKTRFIFGGTIADYRSFFRNVVGG